MTSEPVVQREMQPVVGTSPVKKGKERLAPKMDTEEGDSETKKTESTARKENAEEIGKRNERTPS